MPTPLDNARRVIVFVVNSLSSPPTNWDESENPPGTIDILLKSAGVPIDHYSYEAVELLKDTASRWRTLRAIRDSAAMKTNKDPAVADMMRIPNAEIYAIDVSFPKLKDKAELDYLNQQPTSFVLPPEAVDRLRAAAGTIIMDSPEFQRLLKDVGATIVPAPANRSRLGLRTTAPALKIALRRSNGRLSQHSIVRIQIGLVAAACGRLESAPIENRDVAPAVVNQAPGLQ